MSMMTKTFCHDGHCESIHKENREGHSKMGSAEPFISTAVILFLFTVIAVVICAALVEIFTL
jgi:hypothetical protein